MEYGHFIGLSLWKSQKKRYICTLKKLRKIFINNFKYHLTYTCKAKVRPKCYIRVIAIFLVLVCLFYLSFSWVTKRYEDKATEYAMVMSGGDAASDSYKKAYKNYIDSIGKEKVYPVLGYTFNQVQKMGVGLGLDLKGGMNVILQVSVPDILRSMANAEGNKTFNAVISATDSVVKKTKTSDYVAAFFKEYQRIDPLGRHGCRVQERG